MKKTIHDILEESIRVKQEAVQSQIDLIQKAVELLVNCLKSGNKILIFGNGGSAADAQHIAAEFINRFNVDREPLAALALTTDTSVITSIGNDYDYNLVFSKQIQALGKKGDVAWGISTSGNSKNVVHAAQTAKDLGLINIGMVGRGGELAKHIDYLFKVPSDTTARIQETHITIAHILCDLVERQLFPKQFC